MQISMFSLLFYLVLSSPIKAELPQYEYFRLGRFYPVNQDVCGYMISRKKGWPINTIFLRPIGSDTLDWSCHKLRKKVIRMECHQNTCKGVDHQGNVIIHNWVDSVEIQSRRSGVIFRHISSVQN